MTLEFLNELIENKINQNKYYIQFTFYELIAKYDLHSCDSDGITQFIKQKLINYGYTVYTTGENYTFNSITYTIPINILLIAIKSPTA